MWCNEIICKMLKIIWYFSFSRGEISQAENYKAWWSFEYAAHFIHFGCTLADRHQTEKKSMIIIHNLKIYLVISSTIVASSALYNELAHAPHAVDIQKPEHHIGHKYVYKLCNITFHGVLDLSMSSYRRCWYAEHAI